MKMKKIVLTMGASLGVAGGLVIPIIQQANNTQEKKNIVSKNKDIVITTKSIEKFVNYVNTSIHYMGENQYGYIPNNLILNIGMNGLTFEYGWSRSESLNANKYYSNYESINDLSNGDYFCIRIAKLSAGYVLDNPAKKVFQVGIVQNLNMNPTKSSFTLTGGNAENRIYTMVLSGDSTLNMRHQVNPYQLVPVLGGKIIYSFLTSFQNYWKYGSVLSNSLNNYDDNESFQELFQGNNSHAQFNFNYRDFVNVLMEKSIHHRSIKIELRVDYKFLAHNLYAIYVV